MQYGISSGAVLKSLAEGLVSLYEEHETRAERGIGLEAWGNMAMNEKAFLIAQRRITLSLKNLQAEAEIKDSERKAKRMRRK